MPAPTRLSLSPSRARSLGLLLHVALLGHVHAVQELTDILVSDSADLLDVGGGLGDVLERVAKQDELILLVLGDLDLNTLVHDDPPDELLANEVADLDLEQASLVVLVEVDVDGEMGVDVAHLVLEALGDTDNQVLNQGADGAETGNGLAGAVVDGDGNDILLGLGEANGHVAKVLDELAAGSLDGDGPGLDVDLDCCRVTALAYTSIVSLCVQGVPVVQQHCGPRVLSRLSLSHDR